MKRYTKVYLSFFGYSIADTIMCECCEKKKAVDIHHVWARSIRKDLENDIRNLMALCRLCHEKFGDKKQHREYLQELHDKKLNSK